jgi:hypothetical protein
MDKIFMNVRRHVDDPPVVTQHQKLLSSGKNLNYIPYKLVRLLLAVGPSTSSDTLFEEPCQSI